MRLVHMLPLLVSLTAVFFFAHFLRYYVHQEQEDWQRQKAVIFVLIEAITQGNQQIIDNSKRLFYYSDFERDKLCF